MSTNAATNTTTGGTATRVAAVAGLAHTHGGCVMGRNGGHNHGGQTGAGSFNDIPHLGLTFIIES